MKRIIVNIVAGILYLPLTVVAQSGSAVSSAGWKAGVASANITPQESMWMSGFGFRNKPSEGVTTDIWASALALEDKHGKQVVLIAVDNSGIRKDISDSIRIKLKSMYHLDKDQVVINSSHTHTVPATSERWARDPIQKEKIKKYAEKLEMQIVEITGEALKNLEPVNLYAANGVTRFQVNRRNNIQYKLHLQSVFNGPNDYAVPVLKVEKPSGDLLAILFGYACHASMLRDYNFSGDYPAFARMELRKLYPRATPLFFQGAGGNLIGHPRNTVEATRQAGKTLAAAVESVLSEPMSALPPILSTSYSEINLESDQVPPSKETLNQLNRSESAVATYPYPVQVWKLGNLPLITLGGEPVVEYAIQIKLLFGQESFVFGYSNDVMAYISTPLILKEGGYEGSSSPFSSYTAQRGVKWALNIEARIMEEVLALAKKVGIEMTPKKFTVRGD